METTVTNVIEQYATWGLSIIPIAPKSKKPLIDWKKAQLNPLTTTELLKWYVNGSQTNVGLVCGKVSGNLVVLDFDEELPFWDFMEQFKNTQKVEDIHQITPVVRTNRGYHVYFRTKDPVRTQKLSNVDIKGEGSFVLAPPSIHPLGNRYGFVNPDIKQILEIESLLTIGIERHNQPSNELERIIQGVSEGERNDSAFKMARVFKENGITLESFMSLLQAWNDRNNPPLPVRELEQTVKSAYSSDRGLTAAIREFVNQTQGSFSITQLDTELGITNKQKMNRKTILSRLTKEGLIERIKPGHYRVKESCLPDMDWQNADTGNGLDIRFPFDIHELVEIYPKNILILAGTTNAGKTAYLLNFIKLNMSRHEIHYFTSELSEQELKKRIDKFGEGLDWQFHPHERNGNFDGVIIPHAINVIDYLEPPSGEYYAIGDQISAIHNRLTTGIAFIAIQKKRKTELGRGAEFSEERARLYLSMDFGKLKIVKAKNWCTDSNPNGIEYTFKLVDGCNFRDIQRSNDANTH